MKAYVPRHANGHIWNKHSIICKEPCISSEYNLKRPLFDQTDLIILV